MWAKSLSPTLLGRTENWHILSGRPTGKCIKGWKMKSPESSHLTFWNSCQENNWTSVKRVLQTKMFTLAFLGHSGKLRTTWKTTSKVWLNKVGSALGRECDASRILGVPSHDWASPDKWSVVLLAKDLQRSPVYQVLCVTFDCQHAVPPARCSSWPGKTLAGLLESSPLAIPWTSFPWLQIEVILYISGSTYHFYPFKFNWPT